MKKIIQLMSDYKKESILAPLFKMLEAFLELFVPLAVASIIDEGIYYNDRRHIIYMCLIMLALAVTGLVFSITAQYFSAKAAVGMAVNLRHQLFSHILTFGYAEMDQIGGATLITRMTSDINQIQNAVNMVLRLLLRSPFIVFGAMVMAFTIDFRAALIFVVTIPLLSVVVFGIMFLTKPVYKKVQKSLDKILNITRENLTGVRVIRAFNREESERKQFMESNGELASIQKFAGKISGLTNPLTFVIINFAIIILIHTGALRVNAGSLSQGQVVALYNYMSQILVELIKMANFIVLITRGLACMGRINDILDISVSMEEGRGAGDNAWNGEACSVEFADVSFCYGEGGDDALSHVSFRAAPGETIGILGGTGSGKTTLVNLIPRFYDATKGKVLINGRNVRDYTSRELHDRISVVPQKAQLFEGTIRSNLVLGCPGAAPEEIEEAVRISQAKEFVDQKEGRLDAKVEQAGRNLSGGQKQRLTLARALVRKSGILIMDDSASALDYATDARLRQAIRGMKQRPTVFIVSQRASSVLHADLIIVLDDGQVAGIGDHKTLLASCDIYREIYETQFKKEA